MRHKQDTQGFRSRWGFILACVGSAVGMGNLWRFPYMLCAWGGMSFLLPYLLSVVLVSVSGMVEEMALGRATGKGPMGAFGVCTAQRTANARWGAWIGLVPVLGALGLAVGYTVVVGWIVRYVVLAQNGSLYALGQDMDAIGAVFAQTASAWGNNVYLMAAMIGCFVILACGVAGGIERVGKVMMPLLFALLVGLAIYIGQLPGARDGYAYLLRLDMHALSNPKLWIYAFGQAFFSLSVAGNGMVVYGSYLDKKEDLVAAAVKVSMFDTIAAILAALVIIPAMAAGGAALDTGGPGLMFIYLLRVFNAIPGGRVVGTVFYIGVLLAGVTSLINLYEVPIAALEQKRGVKRGYAAALVCTVGTAAALCIQGIVSGWMDAVSIYICPLGAMLAAMMFFWVADRDFAEDAVAQGRHKRTAGWFIPLGRYVFVPLCALALVLGVWLGGIG